MTLQERDTPMRVVYWAKLALARALITERLKSLDGVDLVVANTLPELLAALPGAQALILYDAPHSEAEVVVKALADPTSTVRWMHFITAGREGFESAGLPKNIAITYAAGAVSPAVAEHAMAMLLAIGRRVPDMLIQQAERKWDRAIGLKAFSLEGLTMLLVGFGHIGRELVPRAKAFGMKVNCVSRSATPEPMLDKVYALNDLHEALNTADVIVIAIALTEQTHQMMGFKEFAACKKGSVLINIARGGIVDQVALREALESGQLAGAGIDVTDPEPLPADDQLWNAPNLLLSPHYGGGGSPESLRRLADGTVENLQRLMQGVPLHNIVVT